MLNILEGFDLKAMGRESAEFWHVMVEAKKLAFENRARYYADMEFADVPLKGLLSKEFGRRQAARIDMSLEEGAPVPVLKHHVETDTVATLRPGTGEKADGGHQAHGPGQLQPPGHRGCRMAQKHRTRTVSQVGNRAANGRIVEVDDVGMPVSLIQRSQEPGPAGGAEDGGPAGGLGGPAAGGQASSQEEQREG